MGSVVRSKKKRSNSFTLPSDPKKEAILSELSEVLKGQGVTVRREKLKQGNGWKALSGSCRVQQNRIIFLDKRLPQGDQMQILFSQVSNMGIDLSDQPTISVELRTELGKFAI